MQLLEQLAHFEAITTIKEILRIEESLIGKILIFDFLKMNFAKSNLKKNPIAIFAKINYGIVANCAFVKKF